MLRPCLPNLLVKTSLPNRDDTDGYLQVAQNFKGAFRRAFRYVRGSGRRAYRPSLLEKSGSGLAALISQLPVSSWDVGQVPHPTDSGSSPNQGLSFTRRCPTAPLRAHCPVTGPVRLRADRARSRTESRALLPCGHNGRCCTAVDREASNSHLATWR